MDKLVGMIIGFLKKGRKRYLVVHFPSLDVTVIPELNEFHVGSDFMEYLSTLGRFEVSGKIFYELPVELVGYVQTPEETYELYKTRYFYFTNGCVYEDVLEIMEFADVVSVGGLLICRTKKY